MSSSSPSEVGKPLGCLLRELRTHVSLNVGQDTDAEQLFERICGHVLDDFCMQIDTKGGVSETGVNELTKSPSERTVVGGTDGYDSARKGGERLLRKAVGSGCLESTSCTHQTYVTVT
jgi:hypothetical protein